MNRARRPTALALSWLSLFGTIALAGACGRGVLEDLPEREVATEETGNLPAENEPSSEGPPLEPEVLGPEPRGAQPPPPSPPRGPNGDAGAEGAASTTPLDSAKPPAPGTVTEENQPALLLDAGWSPPADEAAPARAHAPPERETSQEPGPEQQPSVLQYVEIAPATGTCTPTAPGEPEGSCWLGEVYSQGLTLALVDFAEDLREEPRLRAIATRWRNTEMVAEATGLGPLGEPVCTVRALTPGVYSRSAPRACKGAVSAQLRVWERVRGGLPTRTAKPPEAAAKVEPTCSLAGRSLEAHAVLSCPGALAQARLHRGSARNEDERRWLGVRRGPSATGDARASAYDAAGAKLCEVWSGDSGDWVYTAHPDCSGAVELRLEAWGPS